LWPALKDSTQVMLKIPNPLDDEIHGAEILKIFDGQGAVQVLESDRHIYISERIGVLGQSTLPDLVRQGDDDRATLIICDVIEHLHRASAEKK
ncbi:aminoglycoside phosphotransferase family protein, partial [Klebsiella pneumoniae]